MPRACEARFSLLGEHRPPHASPSTLLCQWPLERTLQPERTVAGAVTCWCVWESGRRGPRGPGGCGGHNGHGLQPGEHRSDRLTLAPSPRTCKIWRIREAFWEQNSATLSRRRLCPRKLITSAVSRHLASTTQLWVRKSKLVESLRVHARRRRSHSGSRGSALSGPCAGRQEMVPGPAFGTPGRQRPASRQVPGLDAGEERTRR